MDQYVKTVNSFMSLTRSTKTKFSSSVSKLADVFPLVHAQWAIVFAQLHINGKNEGIHCFLTRIRNEDGSVCKGVRIEDMGKYGK